MSKPKKALYLSKHVRLCERRALDELGLTDDDLMMRAGTAALNTLKKLYPDVRTIAVFCGGGNNAGDGYVLARLLFQQADGCGDTYTIVGANRSGNRPRLITFYFAPADFIARRF